MKFKPSRIETAFLMGVGFHYMATHPKGFLYALSEAIQDECKQSRVEYARIVDPYNRDVDE